MLWMGIVGALALQSAGVAPSRTPTDVELKSAYCLQVLEAQQSSTVAALAQPGGEVWLRAAFQAAYAGTAGNLARLHAYLDPRVASLDPLALSAALGRGQADASDMLAAVAAPSGHVPDGLTQRVQSCATINWLPF